KTVSEYYNPTKEKKQAPEYLLDYYNYYLELKGHEIKEKIRTWQKWITVRNKLERMQQSLGEKHKVKDVNEDFIKDWIDYCKSENYSNQTTKKEFSYIKTICLHA